MSRLFLCALLACATQFSQAQTFHFHALPGGPTGANPTGSVLAHDLLYGTAVRQGNPGRSGHGVVFAFDMRRNSITPLHLFAGAPSDGAEPYAGLIADDAGAFFGTTYAGGANNMGTVYKMDSAGGVTLLHSFGGTDGQNPGYGALVRDKRGNLYGVTTNGGMAGGANGYGVIYRVGPTGEFSTLYAFAGTDGANPVGGLLLKNGSLFGTTTLGGRYGHGTIFKYTIASAAFQLVRSFGRELGAHPVANLIRDHGGNLYGTTYAGSAGGRGAVFKLDSTYHETVLAAFNSSTNPESPASGLLFDAAGNLYGTSNNGGVNGVGSVFKIDTTGQLTILHSFEGHTDGAHPRAGLAMDTRGHIWGATTWGGGADCGVIFEFKP